MNRRQFVEALGAVATAVLMATLWIDVGRAHEVVRIEGRVLWISGEIMVVAPYSVVAFGAGAINVDLSQVDQDEYAGLVMGYPVVVTGTVDDARNRVIATSVQHLAHCPTRDLKEKRYRGSTSAVERYGELSC